jgi:hypothetical protein
VLARGGAPDGLDLKASVKRSRLTDTESFSTNHLCDLAHVRCSLPVILSQPAKKLFKRPQNLLMSDLPAHTFSGKGVIMLGQNQNPQSSIAAPNNRAAAAGAHGQGGTFT